MKTKTRSLLWDIKSIVFNQRGSIGEEAAAEESAEENSEDSSEESATEEDPIAAASEEGRNSSRK